MQTRQTRQTFRTLIKPAVRGQIGRTSITNVPAEYFDPGLIRKETQRVCHKHGLDTRTVTTYQLGPIAPTLVRAIRRIGTPNFYALFKREPPKRQGNDSYRANETELTRELIRIDAIHRFMQHSCVRGSAPPHYHITVPEVQRISRAAAYGLTGRMRLARRVWRQGESKLYGEETLQNWKNFRRAVINEIAERDGWYGSLTPRLYKAADAHHRKGYTPRRERTPDEPAKTLTRAISDRVKSETASLEELPAWIRILAKNMGGRRVKITAQPAAGEENPTVKITGVIRGKRQIEKIRERIKAVNDRWLSRPLAASTSYDNTRGTFTCNLELTGPIAAETLGIRCASKMEIADALQKLEIDKITDEALKAQPGIRKREEPEFREPPQKYSVEDVRVAEGGTPKKTRLSEEHSDFAVKIAGFERPEYVTVPAIWPAEFLKRLQREMRRRYGITVKFENEKEENGRPAATAPLTPKIYYDDPKADLVSARAFLEACALKLWSKNPKHSDLKNAALIMTKLEEDLRTENIQPAPKSANDNPTEFVADAGKLRPYEVVAIRPNGSTSQLKSSLKFVVTLAGVSAPQNVALKRPENKEWQEYADFKLPEILHDDYGIALEERGGRTNAVYLGRNSFGVKTTASKETVKSALALVEALKIKLTALKGPEFESLPKLAAIAETLAADLRNDAINQRDDSEYRRLVKGAFGGSRGRDILI